ncbi:MAG: 1,4-dihydroxy-6-naphthoate synthase [Candidatus Eremiobacteraeota bacterium]|nr:1,4-dihydroxy-6-naphthoate synthase [Candidatus Eremiobacteraeota bacterium]
MSQNGAVSLAYSPCPNDTYIFAAWTNGLLRDVPRIETVLDDVEALNEAALAARYVLTKSSYGAAPLLLRDYRILRAGGALGRGCGPLLVARPLADGAARALGTLSRAAVIAIPGKLTTAYLLLRLALGYEPDVRPMRFDAIVDAVASNEVDAGLIIHESRFTYARAGLIPVADLGAWWEQETGLPIPLGAILVRRDVTRTCAAGLSGAIRKSLAFARNHEDAVAPYVRAHAFEMDEAVMRAHIALYVNKYSDDVAEDGVAAVHELLRRAASAGLVRGDVTPEFL